MNGYMRRDRQVSSAMLQSLQYDWLYVNQTICLYMTTTPFPIINSPYRWVCRCCNINDDSNRVD